jgi:hypothetical protein
MSSALAMVLMAAIAIPGNGPEKVSGEMVQELDLSGKWEGTFRLDDFLIGAEMTAGILNIKEGFLPETNPLRVINEGDGRLCLMEMEQDRVFALGIYMWERHCVIFHIRADEKGRPLSFDDVRDTCIYNLHRVKPRK